MRTIGDMGIKAAQGVVDYGKSWVGRADLVSGGMAGDALRSVGYDPEATNQFLGDYLSDSQKASDQKVASADGFVNKIIAGVQNPRALMGGIVESLPDIGETYALGGLTAARIGLKAALASDEGMAAAKSVLSAGGTEQAAAQAALQADTAAAKAASAASGVPVKSAAETAINNASNTLHAVGAASMGSISAGNIAETAAENGRSYDDYALPSIAAGVGTGLLTYGTGKLMGDSKLQMATGADSVGVAGNKLMQMGKEALHQGVLQGMPQAAQEQYFTNVANGEPDLMRGVENAAADSLVSGAVMGVGTGALAHGQHAAGQVDPQLVPETGTLTRAANAGQTATAAIANANADLSKSIDYTPTSKPVDPSTVKQPLSLYDPTDPANHPHPNAIDYTAPEKVQNTAGLENLQKFSTMGQPFGLQYLQDAIPRWNMSGEKPLTIIPHADGGYTAAPTRFLSQSILNAVQHLQTPAEPGSMDSILPPISHQALQDMATTRAMFSPTGFGEHAQMEGLLKEDRDRNAAAQAEQSRIEALQQQQAARAAAQQQDEAIKAADARTAAAYKAQADANRAALREQVLSNDAIASENKKDAYAALLKRDGYINPRLTDEDHDYIDDAIRPEASSPNELTDAVPEKVVAPAVRSGKVNTVVVDAAIAQGMRLKTPSGNILHKPGSTKIFKLNDRQRSYYQQAIKAHDVNGNVSSGSLEPGIARKNDQIGLDHAGRNEAQNVSTENTQRAAVDGLARSGRSGANEDQEAHSAPLTALDRAAHEAATSPLNDLAEPTDAQKEAGNYAKGHVRFNGLDISVENPAGSTRSGVARDGTPWETTVQHHYGYIRGTVGMDKDHIDAFIGKHEDSKKVFVVDQANPETGKPDEHKVMLGFNSMQEARDAYQSNYDKDWTGGNNIAETSMDAFKDWLKNGNTKQPFARNAPEGSIVSDVNAAVKVPPGLERARRLKEEREAAKLRAAEAEKERQARAVAPEKTPEQPAAPQKSAEDIAFDSEMADALAHLGDVLGDVFGAKLNITGQQHTAGDLLPALSKVIELLVRKGARSLAQAVTEASKLMRANPAIAPHVDKISPRQWKAAYNAIAEFHPGTDSEMDVANTHPDAVTGYAAPSKPTEANNNPERYKGHSIYMPSMGNGFMARDLKGNGKQFGSFVAGPFATKDGARAAIDASLAAKNTSAAESKPKSVSTAPEHAQNTGTPLNRDVKYDKTADQANKIRQADIDESIVPLTMDKSDFKEITDEWANLFADPDKRTITGQRVKDQPVMSVEAAKKVVEGWKEHAKQQGEQYRSENSQKTVLSLFDLSGEWSKPWKEAGYNVVTMDIQTGQDVHDFSAEYFNENYDLTDVYAILAATPCTDFASSGSRHFAAKDADGRTEASKQLVFQTLRTIEYFRPAVWCLENPVGRIEDLTGLPKARMSFDPNHFGEPYTKKTMLWGNFNADLPTAHVEPTEGSKMWAKYGGKSQATKNARSVTPEGFAYAFFMANNYIDMPKEEKLTAQYPEASGAVKQALKAGVSEQRIHDLISDHYGNYDYADARNALAQEVADIKSGKVQASATADQPAETQADEPKLSAKDLNRLSVKQMSDAQLMQARDELPKRADPIAKEMKLRGLDEPEQATGKSQVIQESIDGKRDAPPTLEKINAEQDGRKPLDPNAIATRYAQLLAEGRKGVSPTPTDFHRQFADDLINKDAYHLKWITNGLNDKSKKVFAEFTGEKLPKAQGAAWEKLKEWAGVTPEQDKAHEKAKAAAFKAKQAAEDAADAEKAASNQRFRTSNEDNTIISGKDVIDRHISEGYTSIENISKGAVPKYALVNRELGRYYPLDKVGRKYAEVALSRLGKSTETKDGNADKRQTVDQAKAEQIEHERELAAAKANGQIVASDADAAHLFGKNDSTEPDLARLPIKPLSDIRVDVDVRDADTGKPSQKSIPADVAMRDVSFRVKALEDFIACMTG
jgi:hypothetical protein